jgi:hypothetical protein
LEKDSKRFGALSAFYFAFPQHLSFLFQQFASSFAMKSRLLSLPVCGFLTEEVGNRISTGKVPLHSLITKYFFLDKKRYLGIICLALMQVSCISWDR